MKISRRENARREISRTIFTEYARQINKAKQPIELEKIIYNVVFDERLTYGDCMQVTGIARYHLHEMRRRIADEQHRIMCRNIARIEA